MAEWSTSATAGALSGGFERGVVARLRKLGNRNRLVKVGSGSSRLVMAAVSLALLDLGADWFLRFDFPVRAVLLAGAGATFLTILVRRVLTPLLRGDSAESMALIAERHFPHLDDVLISSVQLWRHPRPELYSSELVERLCQDASNRVRSVRFDSAIGLQPLRNRALWAGAALLVLGAVVLLVPGGTMRTWFVRNVALAQVDWPKRTRLLVVGAESGRIVHPRGDDLELKARLGAGSERPRRVLLEYRLASGGKGRESMVSVGLESYRFTFGHLIEPMRFRLTGGDEETEWTAVEVVDRPRIERVEITVTPPAYTGLASRTLRTNQTSARILAGSRIGIRFWTNVEVTDASLVDDEAELAAVELIGSRMGTCELRPHGDVNAEFRLTDAHGLQNVRPVRVILQVRKDEPPVVRMSIEGATDSVTPQAILGIHIDARDRYGLGEVSLAYEGSRAPVKPRTRAMPEVEQGSTKYSGSIDWRVSEADASVGDLVTLQAIARDLDDVGGPNEGRSFLTRLRVISAEELLAELGRREQESRLEFERVLGEQEDLRSAVLSALSQRQSGPIGKDEPMPRRLADSSRRERQLMSRIRGTRAQFVQILEELEANGLAGPAVQKRLRDGVIAPLEALVSEELAAVNRLLSAAEPDEAELDRQLREAIERMREVLSNMLQWEGYQEALALLRNLIDMQEEIRKQTAEARGRRIRELFEEE